MGLTYIHSVSQFSCSVVSDSATPWITTLQASLSITNSRVHPNPCPLRRRFHPTNSSSFSPFSCALNLSQHQGLFKWDSSSHQVAKVLELQLHHQSYQWTPGLNSFRMDWLDLLANVYTKICVIYRIPWGLIPWIHCMNSIMNKGALFLKSKP